MDADLYWTIITGVVTAFWTAVVFRRASRSESVQRSSAIVERLVESERLIVDHPEIQQYLSLNATKGEEYFRDAAVLDDPVFYKAKAHAYGQLNLFDDILSTASAKEAEKHSKLGSPS